MSQTSEAIELVRKLLDMAGITELRISQQEAVWNADDAVDSEVLGRIVTCLEQCYLEQLCYQTVEDVRQTITVYEQLLELVSPTDCDLDGGKGDRSKS